MLCNAAQSLTTDPLASGLRPHEFVVVWGIAVLTVGCITMLVKQQLRACKKAIREDETAHGRWGSTRFAFSCWLFYSAFSPGLAADCSSTSSPPYLPTLFTFM